MSPYRVCLALTLLALASPAAAQFSFAPPTVSPHPVGTFGDKRVHLMNLDGDEVPDLLISSGSDTAVARFQNSPTPGFTTTLVAGFGGGIVHAADLNGDGFDDILRVSGTTITYLLNNGQGGFPGVAGSFSVTGGIICDILVANFDHEPGLEIAVFKRDGSPYYLEILDLAQGTPFLTATVATTVSSFGNSFGNCTFDGMEAVDLDGDGDLDIALSSGEVFLNLSNLAFLAPTNYPQIFTHGAVASGDLNGDGNPDLVFTQTSGQAATPGLRWFLSYGGCNRPSQAFRPEVQALPNFVITNAKCRDFDGDGRDEILFQYAANPRQLAIQPLNLNGQLGGPYAVVLGSASTGFDAADFDQDGDVDIVVLRNDGLLFLANTTAGGEVIAEAPGTTPRFVWVDGRNRHPTANGSALHPYRTIAEAVSNGQPGDAVMVRPGAYSCASEGTTRILLSDRQLVGVGGPDATFLNDVYLECDGVTRIQGFTIRHANGTSGAGAITAKDQATILGNRLLGGSPGEAVVVANNGSGTNPTDARIGSNVMYGFRSGVLVESGDPANGFSMARIYNNTIVDTAFGVSFAAAGVIEIVNNLICGTGTYGVRRDCSTPTLPTLLVDHNFIDKPQPYSTTSASCALVPGSNDILAPWQMSHFVDAAQLDFRMHPLSPAIDAGSPALASTVWLGQDLEGDPRSVRSLNLYTLDPGMWPDIGADEYSVNKIMVARNRNSWSIERTFVANSIEITAVSWGPGIWPFENAHSLALVNHWSMLVTLPLSIGPQSNYIVPVTPIFVGTRLYVQSVVFQPSNNPVFPDRYTMTNAAIMTTFR